MPQKINGFTLSPHALERLNGFRPDIPLEMIRKAIYEYDLMMARKFERPLYLKFFPQRQKYLLVVTEANTIITAHWIDRGRIP